MKEGCITERGTHEELMNLNGDYATIFNNLLLGETPPVEVRLTGFVCLISTQGDMVTRKPEELSLTLSACGSQDHTSVPCSPAPSPVGEQDEEPVRTGEVVHQRVVTALLLKLTKAV